MRIHAYDRSRDHIVYDISIGGSGFGVEAEVSEEHYRAFSHVLDVYEDCQETLERLYKEALEAKV